MWCSHTHTHKNPVHPPNAKQHAKIHFQNDFPENTFGQSQLAIRLPKRSESELAIVWRFWLPVIHQSRHIYYSSYFVCAWWHMLGCTSWCRANVGWWWQFRMCVHLLNKFLAQRTSACGVCACVCFGHAIETYLHDSRATYTTSKLANNMEIFHLIVCFSIWIYFFGEQLGLIVCWLVRAHSEHSTIVYYRCIACGHQAID